MLIIVCHDLVGNDRQTSTSDRRREALGTVIVSTLLKIDVSPRGDASLSRALADVFVDRWRSSHPDTKVVVRDLANTELPFVEMPWIIGANSDPGGHGPVERQALAIGEEMIAELANADHYLVSTPMYNFAIPAKLKAYIDHVVRLGKTFSVTEDGQYVGLLAGKRATVILASLGSYSPGSPAEGYDYETPYLRMILGFIGVAEVTFVRAGGAMAIMRGEQTADQFLASHVHDVEAAAST